MIDQLSPKFILEAGTQSPVYFAPWVEQDSLELVSPPRQGGSDYYGEECNFEYFQPISPPGSQTKEEVVGEYYYGEGTCNFLVEQSGDLAYTPTSSLPPTSSINSPTTNFAELPAFCDPSIYVCPTTIQINQIMPGAPFSTHATKDHRWNTVEPEKIGFDLTFPMGPIASGIPASYQDPSLDLSATTYGPFLFSLATTTTRQNDGHDHDHDLNNLAFSSVTSLNVGLEETLGRDLQLKAPTAVFNSRSNDKPYQVLKRNLHQTKLDPPTNPLVPQAGDSLTMHVHPDSLLRPLGIIPSPRRAHSLSSPRPQLVEPEAGSSTTAYRNIPRNICSDANKMERQPRQILPCSQSCCSNSISPGIPATG